MLSIPQHFLNVGTIPYCTVQYNYYVWYHTDREDDTGLVSRWPKEGEAKYIVTFATRPVDYFEMSYGTHVFNSGLDRDIV